MHQIEILQPDDWHCHLRDGPYLANTVAFVANQFKRAIIMPNLNPPVTTVQQAGEYLERIQQCIPPQCEFTPLMTLYLTDATTPQTIKEAKDSGIIFACKLYPANVTTNSKAGITAIENLTPVLAAMSQAQLPLLIHGEVNDSNVDVFDREKIFIERHLQWVVQEFPDLKIVFEHITTLEAVDFVLCAKPNVAATITPHHLLLNRNELFTGGIRPHHYCLPIVKRKIHQQALIEAATSGNPKFFLGTDSAPHAKSKKESDCGCAGIFNHHAAIELYAQAFEQAQKLEKLEGFASRFGPDFYGLPQNKQKLILRKSKWQIPETFEFGNEPLIPFLAGKECEWQIASLSKT